MVGPLRLSQLFALGLVCCYWTASGLGPSRAADDYKLGPDSQVKEGIPHGTVVSGQLTSETVFPGTVRNYWVYLPPGYKPEEQAALMVFQDGGSYQDPQGGFRVPVVFDNLIEQKAIPRIVGVFLNPGTIPAARPGEKPRENRSFEYDSLGGQYAKFVVDEALPSLMKQHNFQVSTDPERRAICGISSGGICAFTAAWERPDQFRKVLSHIGSFTNIRGGHVYPSLIRKTERKPLRVFLQAGSNDLDNIHGHWPLANQEMAAALKFMGYEHEFVMGDGAHNAKHGGAILPDSLRWLWRDVR